jgi:hypothetical protein
MTITKLEAIQREPGEHKHAKDNAQQCYKCLNKVINCEPDDSINPSGQKNGPNDPEGSTKKSYAGNLHADMKEQLGNPILTVSRMV